MEAPSISLVDSLGADDGTLQLETAKLNKLCPEPAYWSEKDDNGGR